MIDHGRRPGLVVMGGDSCSKGRELKSLHHILDGYLFANRFVVNFFVPNCVGASLVLPKQHD